MMPSPGGTRPQWNAKAICILISFALVLPLSNAIWSGALSSSSFSLFTEDGVFYPVLDAFLQKPGAYVISSSVELTTLPLYNASSKSLVIQPNTSVAVFASGFFSVFAAVPAKLWEVQNGTEVVPVFCEVRAGAELLLVGFTLSWGAVASSGRLTPSTANSTTSQQLPILQPLLERLRMYAEVSSAGRLQILRTTIVGVSCEDLQRLYIALGILRSGYSILASVSGGVKPEMRYVFPYLFIKYAQVGSIWVEDLTLSCAASADLSPAACPTQPPAVYDVASHDELMTALTTLEATDVPSCVTQRTVLRLVTDVHLDMSRWPRQTGGVFLTSNVTFEGVYGRDLILDFGGGLDLFKIRAGAYVQFHNLVIGNMALSPIGAYVVPMWAFQFSRNLSLEDEGRVHLENTTGIVPTDEFVHLQYWTTILTNPTQAIAALAAWQRLIQRMELLRLSADTLTFSRLCGMGMTGSNIVITSRTYGLKLAVQETGVNQLLGTDFRAGPPYTIAVYNPGHLARVLTTPDMFLSLLAEQDGYTNGSATRVLLLLQNNITLDRALWPPGSVLQMRRTFVVQGKPFTNVTLDFGGGTNYVTVLNSGAVQFKYLTLRNAGVAAEYNASTALQQLPPATFLQSGMWPISHDRSGTARVFLSSATLLVSRQELDIMAACWNSLDGARGTPLPAGLTRETCEKLFPDDAQGIVVSPEAVTISVASMHLDAFDADGLVLAVDPDVSRPDLRALMAGTFPTVAASSSAPASDGANTGAIVGGAVGGAVGCVLLVSLLAILLVRRSRRRAQEKQLRSLQQKQAHQLEELAGTNPLAQLILDHLAGRDPAVAQLVVNGGGGGGSGAGSNGMSGNGAGGGTGSSEAMYTASASQSAASGGGQGSFSPQKAASASSSGAATAAAGEAGKPPSGGAAPLHAAPVNVAAADLAELFKHLTILGPAGVNAVATGGGDGHGTRSPRPRGSPPGSGTGTGAGAGAGGAAPSSVFNLAGLKHAVATRLQGRGNAADAQPAARSSEKSGDKAAHGGDKGVQLVVKDSAPDAGTAAGDVGDAVGDSADKGATAARSAADADMDDGRDKGGEKAPDGGDSGGAVAAAPALPEGLQEHLTQSPVLEELLRLSVDLAGEIDDNQLMVTEVVASGGFGTVYKGMWHSLPVAVKIVLFSTASVNRRIALQEAALSKSICHPNIISTYAVDAKPMTVLGRAASAGSGAATSGGAGSKSKSLADIQEWRLYIIQEYADGGTLRRALDKGTFHDLYTGLPFMEMILDIAQGVAAALAHLHLKNVVHGDLNPKNVLLKSIPSSARSAAAKAGWSGKASQSQYLSPAGQAAAAATAGGGGTQLGSYPLVGRCGFAIKVADFGLSVKLADASHISGLRQGTPFYASPELSQQGIFSRAADVYAFGVLLWELYWGRPIWVPDSTAPGGYVQHTNFPHLPPDCPPEYAALTADCLELNHLQRPAFELVLTRLRRMAQGAAREAAAAARMVTTSASSLRTAPYEIVSPTMQGLPAAVHITQVPARGTHSPRHAARDAAAAATNTATAMTGAGGGAMQQQPQQRQQHYGAGAEAHSTQVQRQPMAPSPAAAALSAHQQWLQQRQPAPAGATDPEAPQQHRW